MKNRNKHHNLFVFVVRQNDQIMMIKLTLTPPSFVRTRRALWALKLILPHQKNHYALTVSPPDPWKTKYTTCVQISIQCSLCPKLLFEFFKLFLQVKMNCLRRAHVMGRKTSSITWWRTCVGASKTLISLSAEEGKHLKSLCLSNLHFKRLQCTFSSFCSPTLSRKSNLFIWIMMHEGHTTGA